MFTTPCSPPNTRYLGIRGCGHCWEEPPGLGGFPTLTIKGLVKFTNVFLLFCSDTTPHLHYLPLSDKMPNPSSPSGHPQGDDMRLNKAQSGNARGGRNACRCNQK